MRAVYPVYLTKADDIILVEVPDLEILTEGKDMNDAIDMARDAIELKCISMEDANEKIPEDKRKFVAALDLANGGLMIAMQLLMFFTISNKKVQQKMFNSLFGKKFTRPATKALQAKLKKNEKLKYMTGDEFHKGKEEYKKGLTKAFGYFVTLAASSIFAKRVLVPFVATPLADKTKEWMCRNDKPATTHSETKNTYNENNIEVKNYEKKIESNEAKAENDKHASNLLSAFKK